MIDAKTLHPDPDDEIRAWPRRHPLDALVIALAVVQQVEVWITGVPGPSVAVSLATALWTLPLLLRRRFPFAAPVFAFAVQIGASFIDPNAFGGEDDRARGAAHHLLGGRRPGTRKPGDRRRRDRLRAIAVVERRDRCRVDTGDAIFGMVMAAASR